MDVVMCSAFGILYIYRVGYHTPVRIMCVKTDKNSKSHVKDNPPTTSAKKKSINEREIGRKKKTYSQLN